LLVALDEPPHELKENLAPFGFDLSGIRILDATPDVKAYSKTKSVKEISTVIDVKIMSEITDIRKSQAMRSLEISIYSVQQMLKQEARDYYELTGSKYDRIVIDSLTALKLFGMKGFDERLSIQSFLRFLSELEVTTLLTVEPSDYSQLDSEYFLTRGEIKLYKWRDKNVIRRGIGIERYRGSPHDLMIRPMGIGERGIVVYADKLCAGLDALEKPVKEIAKRVRKVRKKEEPSVSERTQSVDRFTREKQIRDKVYKGTRTL
jgi:KaiC/GvpD/RAD55 family RecA-like ATPase